MPANTRYQVLGFDPHADFHRAASHEIHARLHDDQVAYMNGLAKIHPVNGHCYTGLAGVPDSGHCRGGVHHA